MKIRLLSIATGLIFITGTTGCMTTYDAYGRPVQSVDPGLAVAGIAAAGLIGYALAEGDDDDYRHHDRRYYQTPRHGHYQSYRGCNTYRGHGYYPRHGYW